MNGGHASFRGDVVDQPAPVFAPRLGVGQRPMTAPTRDEALVAAAAAQPTSRLDGGPNALAGVNRDR
jgi:hypothetical protein